MLADPCLSVFGGFDVDTMMTSAGNHVPVVSSSDLMLDEVFAAHPGRTLNGESYMTRKLLRSRCTAPASVLPRSATGRLSQCACLSPPTDGTAWSTSSWRDMPKGGAMMPLDAVIVDDPRVAPDSVKTELADIVSVMNESSLTYGRMLSRDFRLVHGFDAVADTATTCSAATTCSPTTSLSRKSCCTVRS